MFTQGTKPALLTERAGRAGVLPLPEGRARAQQMRLREVGERTSLPSRGSPFRPYADRIYPSRASPRPSPAHQRAKHLFMRSRTLSSLASRSRVTLSIHVLYFRLHAFPFASERRVSLRLPWQSGMVLSEASAQSFADKTEVRLHTMDNCVAVTGCVCVSMLHIVR